MDEVKKNPRFWAGKYWKKNNISDELKEVVEPDNVDVSSIQMHDTLNPLIWESDMKMKSEVRKALLMNAKRFIEFADVESLTFADIILTGSMANFNYNENSDLDVHIVLDFNQISENKDFVGDFFKLKKALWADRLPIQVKGHDVEMYFQDSAEPHHSSGTYSLVRDEWIRKPTTGETSGVTVTTQILPISGMTSGTSGNYFELNGGYLQGFFKLEGFNYELLPIRYGEGITVETLMYLHPDSQGIFYMMGARAEDKYNPYFSGETVTGSTISGVTTSFDNFLDALEPYEELKPAFRVPEDMYETKYSEVPPLDNIKNNVIAFEITQDKKLGYKYVNDDGFVVSNTSSLAINPTTGWTMIAMAFTPDDILSDEELECADQRLGKLVFYVNGRSICPSDVTSLTG